MGFYEVIGQKLFDRSTLYTINLQIKILTDCDFDVGGKGKWSISMFFSIHFIS